MSSASAAYLAATVVRRSVYQITNKSTLSDAALHDIVKHAVKHTPTSFNSQPLRAVLLLGDEHKKLWSIVLESLRKIVPAEAFAASEQKVNGAFASGYGTVLYFTDEADIKRMQEAYSIYADQFPVWADNSQGILQSIVWTALAQEGIGATLQHYNQLIDDEVRVQWKLPATWKLSAQAPFGVPAASYTPSVKEFAPSEERALVFGSGSS